MCKFQKTTGWPCSRVAPCSTMGSLSTVSTVVDIGVEQDITCSSDVQGSVVSFHGLNYYTNTPTTNRGCCCRNCCCCCCAAPKQLLHDVRYIRHRDEDIFLYNQFLNSSVIIKEYKDCLFDTEDKDFRSEGQDKDFKFQRLQ